MFGLIIGCWQHFFRKELLRILVVGLDKSGKTTVLEHLKTRLSAVPGLDSDKILPTVGLNVGHLDAFGVQLLVWDLGGQAGLRSIWDKYFADSHGLVFVVDAAAPGRWDEAKTALDKALGSRELFGAPVLVVANKQDLAHAGTCLELSRHLGLSSVDTRPCKVQDSSALEGEGLVEGLQWLVQACRDSSRTMLMRKRT